MKTWEELVCDVTGFAKAAGRKAADVTDVAKMKIKIAENERTISATMEALGRLLYDSRNGEGSPLDEETVTELIEQVGELENTNADLRASIDNNRCRKTCAACGAVNPEGSAYCNKCGKEL